MAKTGKSVLLDCDPGIDDAVAILLGLASPEISFVGITTVAGNVDLGCTTENALRVAALGGGLDIPVYPGCPKAILGAPPPAAHVHGNDGLGGVRLEPGGMAQAEHGVQALLRIPGEVEDLSLVAIGPLTNLAVMLTQEPEVAGRIGRTVIMGGGIDGGNVTPAAEFNIHFDPEAARAVFESRLRPVLVPLDLTRKAAVYEDWIDRLRAVGTPVARSASGMMDFYLEAVRHRGLGMIIHDATALAVEIWPELFDVRPARIQIVTDHGPERGRTRVDFDSSEPNGSVAVDLDAPTFTARLFERLALL
ncbi:MAG: nucleoside hydrolase [Alphaproteobacteria bacterium]|nr:nucleoside hydrolase [Alphaproteobacteria bacterium]